MLHEIIESLKELKHNIKRIADALQSIADQALIRNINTYDWRGTSAPQTTFPNCDATGSSHIWLTYAYGPNNKREMCSRCGMFKINT